MIKLNDDFSLTEILVKGIFAFCAGVFLVVACCGLLNESNRISEGVVVDKSYSPAYTTTHTVHKGEQVFVIPEYHAASYSIKLEGEKDGETVTYWRSVTEQEYHQMGIGDRYPSSKEGA